MSQNAVPPVYISFSNTALYIGDTVIETSEKLNTFLKKEKAISKRYNKYKPDKKLILTFNRAQKSLRELTGLLSNTRLTPLGRNFSHTSIGLLPPKVEYITYKNLTLVADVSYVNATKSEKKLAHKELEKLLIQGQKDQKINKKKAELYKKEEESKTINEVLNLTRQLNLIDIINTVDRCKRIVQKERRKLFFDWKEIQNEAPSHPWSTHRKRLAALCFRTIRESISIFIEDMNNSVGGININNPQPMGGFGKAWDAGVGGGIRIGFSNGKVSIGGWVGKGGAPGTGPMDIYTSEDIGLLEFTDDAIGDFSKWFKNFKDPEGGSGYDYSDCIEGCYTASTAEDAAPSGDDGDDDPAGDDSDEETTVGDIMGDHCDEGSCPTDGPGSSYDAYAECVAMCGRIFSMTPPSGAGGASGSAGGSVDCQLVYIYEVLGETAAYMYWHDVGDWEALFTTEELQLLKNEMDDHCPGHSYTVP